MRNWLRGRALRAILIGTCLLAILVPTEINIVRSMLAPVSISAASCDFTRLAIPFTNIDRLFTPKPNRNDASANSASAKRAVTSLFISRYYIPDPCAFFDHAGASDSIFRKAFQQACLLLDVPPPSKMVSLEI